MLAFPHPRQEQQPAPSSSPVSPPLSVLSHIQQMQTELLDSALTMAGHSLHRHHPVDALPPNFAMDMAVLDRHAPGFRWQQLNPATLGLGGSTQAELLDHSNHFSLPAGMFLGTPEPARESRDVVMREPSNITTTPTTTGVDGASMACGWPEMTEHQVTNHHVQPSSFTSGPFTAVTESKPFPTLARTTSCPPAMGSVLSSAARMGLRSCRNIPSSPLSGDGPRKRKTLRNELAAAPLTPKVEGLKTIKGELLEADELGPDTDKLGGESSGNGARENPKGTAPANIPKPDYIHVRARRGQATDSHSLAERVRREKISERMKLLQDLVPGCNKITGKAGMLDEIINYVQSLQRQVEFLSMKLAAVSPKSEGSGDSYLGKEVFPLCNSNFPGVGMPPEVSPPPYVHLNMMQSATGASIQQQQGGCGGGCGGGGQMDISMNNNPSGMTTLRRTTSAPVTVSDDFIDSCFRDSSLVSNPAWDFDLQGLYTMELQHQPRQQPAFSPPTSFVTAGHSEMHNLKMEMM